jgi:SAM-dependent methyltransferase
MPRSPTIFDRRLLRARQRRARALGPATFLLDRVADELGERLSAVLRRFDIAVDLGTPTDAVRRVLVASGKVGMVVTIIMRRHGSTINLNVAVDEEALPFADSSVDLVASALALQFVNDLPGTLIQIRRALKPDGLLLAALVGGESLNELRESLAAAESELEGGLSPRVAPFADVRELGVLLQRAGFALPVVDSERLTVRYDSAALITISPHGRDQCAERAAAYAASARDPGQDDGDLCQAFCRRRRPTARKFRDRLAVGLGAA